MKKVDVSAERLRLVYLFVGNVADERVILFSHGEINVAGVRNVE